MATKADNGNKNADVAYIPAPEWLPVYMYGRDQRQIINLPLNTDN